MKRMKKACTLILASIITASIVPSNMLISYAAENSTSITNESIDTKSEGTTIKVKKAWGNPGKQTSIVLSMENNPGIVGLTLQITYDDTVISLAKSENGTAIKGENITFTPPASGSNFVWSGTSVKSDEVSDGTLLTLTFDVNENAKLGEYPITVSCINAVDTKFSRALLSILKKTQNVTPGNFSYIPLQNFKSNSDIDWSKSISGIDNQLYRKYNLNQEEINFINNNVKEMT